MEAILELSQLQQSALFLLSLIAFYSATSPLFKTDKERAYIMSTAASFCMTLSSLPFLSRYLAGGFTEVVAVQDGWTGHQGAKSMVTFFGCYLVADLAVGVIRYRNQIGLLTGWIHHTVYIGIMYHLAVNTELSPIFMVACIMELPTFHLAISHLAPTLRHDALFLTLMFATRICFHAFLIFDCAFPSAALQGSYFPVSILIPSGILHTAWFSNGVKGHLKRRQGKLAKVDSILAAATAVEPEIQDELLPSATDEVASIGSSSPSDSPLITPRTTSPSTLFPSLGLQLPLPATLQLPPLSFPDHRAFGHAVKQSWEDNRDRFRQGMENVRSRKGRQETL